MIDGTDVEAVGVACWLAIFIAFCVLRRAPVFGAAALALIAAFLYVAATASPRGRVASVAVTLGLVAWSLGLAFVRAMISRSVSLELLVACATGATAHFEESIASRLDEAVNFRLATFDGRRFELAPLGRVVSLAARAAYRATRISE
jgi:hypothetical protein